MQISTIAETASSSAHWSSARTQSRQVTTSSVTAAEQSASAATGESSAPALSASSATLMQSAASSSQMATIAASYSTTVAGKSYSGSVQESGGVYTASVPMPPGVSASGSSIESAEMNLNMILDTLA